MSACFTSNNSWDEPQHGSTANPVVRDSQDLGRRVPIAERTRTVLFREVRCETPFKPGKLRPIGACSHVSEASFVPSESTNFNQELCRNVLLGTNLLENCGH